MECVGSTCALPSAEALIGGISEGDSGAAAVVGSAALKVLASLATSLPETKIEAIVASAVEATATAAAPLVVDAAAPELVQAVAEAVGSAAAAATATAATASAVSAAAAAAVVVEQPNATTAEQAPVVAMAALQAINATLVEKVAPLLEAHVWPAVKSFETWVLEIAAQVVELAAVAWVWLQQLTADAAQQWDKTSPALSTWAAARLSHISQRLANLDAALDSPRAAAAGAWSLAQSVWATVASSAASIELPSIELPSLELSRFVPEAQQRQVAAAAKQLGALVAQHWQAVGLAVVLGLAVLIATRRLRAALSSVFTKDARVLILGLDNSGKTTLLLMLRDNRVTIPNRTLAPSTVRLRLDSTRLHATDLGGHDAARARHPWEAHYKPGVTGVIFVVDASDSNADRLDKARRELQAVLQAEGLSGRGGAGDAGGGALRESPVPVLVLGNKIDLGSALSEAELVDKLGLRAGDPRVRVCMCSLVHRMGFGDGLRWLIAEGTAASAK